VVVADSSKWIYYLVGGFNPSEKYYSMDLNGKDYPIYYGQKHVPNHQPVIV
jgi:hypothetical protein